MTLSLRTRYLNRKGIFGLVYIKEKTVVTELTI